MSSRLLLVGLGALTFSAAPPRQAPGLTGTWKFSPEKSAEEGKEAKDPKDAEGRRSRVSRAGLTGNRTPGSRGPGELAGPLGLYAKPLPQLVIIQTDSTVVMTDASGTPRTYRLNGKKELEPLIGADTLEVTARWKDGKLTTERKLGSFGVIREVLSIDPATRELLIAVRLSGGGLSQPINLVRIYDAAPGS